MASSLMHTEKELIIFEVVASENKSKKNAISFTMAEHKKIYKTGAREIATSITAINNPIVFFITKIADIIALSESDTYPPTTGTALDIVYLTPLSAIFPVVYDADCVSLITQTNIDAKIPINQFRKFNKTPDILLIFKLSTKSETDNAVHTDTTGRKTLIQRN